MALFVSRVVIAIYCTSMLQFACIQNMAVSEHANVTGHFLFRTTLGTVFIHS